MKPALHYTLSIMNQSVLTIRRILSEVPYGSITSYGMVAALAGLPRGARLVARVLHACSATDQLPWWRVVRADGSIALPLGHGYEEQAALLAREGVSVDHDGRIDMARYGWRGPAAEPADQ
jgi:methylated-DNA-protein-cysteine methyltransferase-like protein